MRDFAIVPGAVDESSLGPLRESLLGSSFVARSQLAGSFQASRGFAVIFTRAGAAELLARFPFVAPFVTRVLEGEGARALRTLTDRLAGPRRETNAFYLNLLVIPPGGAIEPHVDATLRDMCAVDDAVPELVSVLYLLAPATDGELCLYDGAAAIARIAPAAGAEVHFQGDLRHEVRSFASDDDSALRVSLVCEQYTLGDDALARLPAFKIHSKAGFEAYLRP